MSQVAKKNHTNNVARNNNIKTGPPVDGDLVSIIISKKTVANRSKPVGSFMLGVDASGGRFVSSSIGTIQAENVITKKLEQQIRFIYMTYVALVLKRD